MESQTAPLSPRLMLPSRPSRRRSAGPAPLPGLLVAPLLIAGFIRLWRAPELRFIAVTATLIVVYVLAWVPGKVYHTDGMAPAVLAAGALTAERWIARAHRPRLRRGIVIAAPSSAWP